MCCPSRKRRIKRPLDEDPAEEANGAQNAAQCDGVSRRYCDRSGWWRARNALRFGRTFEDEMRILILHGILHLMGYDHETDTGQMERRERRLRRALGLA